MPHVDRSLKGREIRQDKHRLTTCHIRASDATDWEGRFLHVVAHADSSTISLVNAIDEEVGESRVSASKPSSNSCEKNYFDMGHMHVAGHSRLGLFLDGEELDQRAAEIEKMIWREMAN